MRRVVVAVGVVMVIGIIMRVVTDTTISQRVVQMRLRRQMDGSVVDVECKDSSDQQTYPPTRFVQRAA